MRLSDECRGARRQRAHVATKRRALSAALGCGPQDEPTNPDELKPDELPKPEEIEVETHDIYRHDEEQAFVTLMSQQVPCTIHRTL